MAQEIHLEADVIPQQLRTDGLAKKVQDLEGTIIHNTAEAFLDNIRNLVAAVTLPLLLTTKSAFDSMRTHYTLGMVSGAASAIIKLRSSLSHSSLSENVEAIIAEVASEYQGVSDDDLHEKILEVNRAEYEESWKANYMNEEELPGLLGLGQAEWQLQLSEPHVATAFTSLLSSTIVSSWASLEVLSGDLWVNIVNAHPSTIGRHIIFGGGDTDSEVGKFIAMRDLAEFDFNVASHLGDLLRSKFKFSGPEKMLRAWQAGLGSDEGLKFLNSSGLRLHSQLRHIIVHNAGRIDAQFKRETASVLQIGSAYPIASQETYGFVEEVIQSGIRFLEIAEKT